MIRPADPARDAAACAAIYAPFVIDHPSSFELQPPDAATMEERIARTAATHAWLVDERDGRVAGYAYGGPHRERAAYRWSAEVSVYVDPAFHRRGVGRALYEALFARLRERGYRMAFAGITLPNAGSVGLHEALGFELVGVFRRVGWKAGAWRDVGWWQLQLAPQDETADGPPPPSPR
jgi:L-amino acid N-acyltransferase YncA